MPRNTKTSVSCASVQEVFLGSQQYVIFLFCLPGPALLKSREKVEVLTKVGQWDRDFDFCNSRMGFLDCIHKMPPAEAAQSLLWEPADHGYLKRMGKISLKFHQTHHRHKLPWGPFWSVGSQAKDCLRWNPSFPSTRWGAQLGLFAWGLLSLAIPWTTLILAPTVIRSVTKHFLIVLFISISSYLSEVCPASWSE